MFDTVLVANRGEIARRIMRTCRALGIRTVAIHSDADADAPHVADADRAVRVGPPPAAASYLDIPAVIGAAADTGAQAVHPGYGFLSENAAFAEAVADAGLVWVGPSPDAIRLMGDKAAAKDRMRQAGVPVVPGVDATAMDDDQLLAACADLGFPLLLKAVAGGGGKGMRPVHRHEELADAVAAARREASAAFGDDRLIVERLIARPRHVEIQVFGDTHGSVVHLFERDCSIQRRHQKIVEETPSPAVDDDLRARMGAAAVEAARAVDYVGAGTVEFIVDADHPDDFFFLEMNTRLQVEHPVTEMVTGQDLVAWQLQVAAGQPVPATQDQLTQSGHAIEVRVYAEDPAAGFLPQTGTVARFDVPSGPGIRVDAGIVDGTVVPRFYDPMLAKLVVHADDRPAAVARLRDVLARTVLHGVRSNLDHLADVAAHPAFAAGDIDTGFLDRHLPDWHPGPATPTQLAAVAALLAHHGAAPPWGDPTDPWRRLGPWRMGPAGGTPVRLVEGDTEHLARVRGRGGRLAVTLGAGVHDVALDHDPDAAGRATVTVDGTAHAVVLTVVEDQAWAHVDGRTLRLGHPAATHHADAAAMAGTGALVSPMPGAVLEVRVVEGDRVSGGQVLLLVEAMKMEHPVVAPGEGTVTGVHVGAGDAVEAGAPLVTFEPE